MIPYISVSQFYKEKFGCKVYKISLDAGCTCPNRDGTKGLGGCIFCSEHGSGDFVPLEKSSVTEQIAKAKLLVKSKIKGNGKYIAYFQNFSATYGDHSVLESKYREALSQEDIVGLAIATRPDCIDDDMLLRLKKISTQYFVQIELGLQTSNENTGAFINRCYTDVDFADCVGRIQKVAPNIHVVAHVIFGLPFETVDDMLETVRFICAQKVGGIKFTVLYVVEHTKLADLYRGKKFEALSKSEYFDILKKALILLPQNMVVHRITGDPPKSLVIAPLWTLDKKRVLNELRTFLDRP